MIFCNKNINLPGPTFLTISNTRNLLKIDISNNKTLPIKSRIFETKNLVLFFSTNRIQFESLQGKYLKTNKKAKYFEFYRRKKSLPC
ncbi:hypothetical protein BpHYR1_035763 [Brachionus plicatilis]|uniref:Uncharacterized protein n=1 Tax=Brachionus plicatilis TaxID=10195 RepID=A0A3M7Q8V0_BRAPC|nr:hypothetical protein BpHYR1_035763 [Brachionus plicatilis]